MRKSESERAHSLDGGLTTVRGRARPNRLLSRAPSHRHTAGSDMTRRGEKQREHTLREPLIDWAYRVREVEKEVRAAMEPVEGAPSRRQVVREVVQLGAAGACPGLEIVIPAGSKDLAGKWIAARLAGRGTTREDRRALALELAPPVDEYIEPFYDSRRRTTRYRPVDMVQDRVAKGAEKHFRDDQTPC